MPSFIEKLKLGKFFGFKTASTGSEPVPNRKGGTLSSDQQAPQESDRKGSSSPKFLSPNQLRSLSEPELANHLKELPERAVIRLLQDLQHVQEQELQFRIIRGIPQEKTLKRVLRSELAKKLKRLAEKRLLELEAGEMDPGALKILEISERMQTFLTEPHWELAEELLEAASAPSLASALKAEGSASTRFLELRQRLRSEAEKYQATCREMEELCVRTDPARPLPKTVLENLARRWSELEDRYDFPAGFQALGRFRNNLESQRLAPAPVAAVVEVRKSAPSTTTPAISPRPLLPNAAGPLTPSAQPPTGESEPGSPKGAVRSEGETKRRAGALDHLLQRVRDLGENLGHPKALANLKQLQKELGTVTRWKREFPEKIEEIDTLLKALIIRHNAVATESEWEIWARTDRAARLLDGMEAQIAALEARDDVEAALGLGNRLVEYSKELKALGKLEREKDHELWKKFKSLSDRGWAICEITNQRVVEALKLTLSEHSQEPITDTPALPQPGKTEPPIQFRPAAFEEAVTAKVQLLRSAWTVLGGPRLAAHRETEAAFGRLTTSYFRQLDLFTTHLQRAESALIHRKRGLLSELEALRENSGISGMERLRASRKIQERWKKEEVPGRIGNDLKALFESSLEALNSDLDEEMQLQMQRATASEAKLQSLLEETESKNGSDLSQVLLSLTQLEKDLQTIGTFMGGLKGHEILFSETVRSTAEEFANLKQRTDQLLTQVRAAAKKETQERGAEKERILNEVEELALSADWEKSRARLEELQQLWEKAGKARQAQNNPHSSMAELLFDHVRRYCQKRFASSPSEASVEKHLKERKELVLSLEALLRLQDPETKMGAAESEALEWSYGKVLEYGLRYKQILALDPEGGVLKETKKIMEKWLQTETGQQAPPPELWKSYLTRLRALLKV